MIFVIDGQGMITYRLYRYDTNNLPIYNALNLSILFDIFKRNGFVTEIIDFYSLEPVPDSLRHTRQPDCSRPADGARLASCAQVNSPHSSS